MSSEGLVGEESEEEACRRGGGSVQARDGASELAWGLRKNQ